MKNLGETGDSVKLYCSQVTPQIPAAIATIVLAGEQADSWDLLEKKIAPYLKLSSPIEVGSIRFSKWRISDEHFEDLVVCRTQLQTLELHCHGGIAVRKRILAQLIAEGFEELEADSFELRFAGEAMSKLQLQARLDLPKAAGERATTILLDQLNGSLHNELVQISDELRLNSASALKRIESLVELQPVSERLFEPWEVVLVGPPNVGKSSLINALTGQANAIVHDEAGTTRDWIEATIGYDGWLIRLSDTAGVRSSSDAIEVAGVEKTRQRLKAADCICLVVDANVGWTEVHQEVLAGLSSRQSIFTVYNKIDLGVPVSKPEGDIDAVEVSCLQPEQAAAVVLQGLVSSLPIRNLPVGAPVPFRIEQIRWLEEVASTAESGAVDLAIKKLQQLLTEP